MPDQPQEPPFEQVKWAHEQQIEERKWTHELKRDDAKRAHDANQDFRTEINKETVSASNLTLRTLVLINGGAAIGVLTFLGGVASKTSVDFARVGDVASTIKWFAFGVALAVAGMALAYLTHYANGENAGSMKRTWEHPYLIDTPKSRIWRRVNLIFHSAAILAAITSLVLFLIGMFSTSDAVTHMFLR
ncbi:hypothetical protein [Bradyrhizobium sp. cf659]|uniref:hypothetical protein n=1 Tax=Bradyrhizobium sp. cf659 TaxID=1761771 RepID=UPI0008E2C6D5|nr:hypothetical protein [Bradyrhizobium sp. cf659]SFJ72486.1 hypothetical protein SAMN04487925_110230 [Bradyrhizobium sp. cf659]